MNVMLIYRTQLFESRFYQNNKVYYIHFSILIVGVFRADTPL